MKFNRDIYRREISRMLNHPKAIYVSIIIIAISAIAMMAIAYQHDTYFNVFEMKELAKMDTWFRIFRSLLVLTVVLYISWPIMSILIAACCAIIPPVSKKIDEKIEKEGDSPIQSTTIDKAALKALFSDSFSEEKFEIFYNTLCNNLSSFKKCDIGKLAEIIMFHSNYCSDNQRYRKKRGHGNELNFRPYCIDFYSSVGLSTSTYDRNYFAKSQQNVIEVFREIIDYDNYSKDE